MANIPDAEDDARHEERSDAVQCLRRCWVLARAAQLSRKRMRRALKMAQGQRLPYADIPHDTSFCPPAQEV